MNLPKLSVAQAQFEIVVPVLQRSQLRLELIIIGAQLGLGCEARVLASVEFGDEFAVVWP